MKIFLSLLILSASNIFSQEIMTIGEVYNFEIGDVVQNLYTNSSPPILYRDYQTNRYLNKNFSTNSDTVFYTIEKQNYIPQYSAESQTIYLIDTVIIFYTNLNDTLKLVQDPAQNYVDSCSFRKDSLYYQNENSTCQKKIFEIKSFPLEQNCFENPDLSEKWIADLGKYEYFIGEINGNFGYYFTEAIYYKKGNIECGTFVSEVSELTKKTNFSIFPNPAKNSIEIKSSEKIECIKIYSIDGNCVLNELFQNEIISIEKLKSGLYLIEILTDKNQISIQKLIKN